MSWARFRDGLRKRQLPAAVVICGEGEAAQLEIRRAFPQAVFLDAGSDPAALHREAVTPSLFGGVRIVTSNLPALPPWLAAWAARVPRGVHLVVRVPASKARLPEGEHLLVLPDADPRAEQAVATKRVRDSGLRLDGRAAEMLIVRCAGNAARLDRELEKLAAFAGPGGRVTVEDVQALVPDGRAHNAFDLIRMILENKSAEALRLLDRLLAQGEPIPRLMGALGWQLRKMLEVRRLMDQGMPGPAACHAAGIRYRIADLLGALGRTSASDLRRAHGRLLRADHLLKTSGQDERVILTALVVELAANRNPRGPG